MFDAFIPSVSASRCSPCARPLLPSIGPSIGLRLPDETGIGLSVVWFRQKVVPSRCVAIFVELRHSLGAPIKWALLAGDSLDPDFDVAFGLVPPHSRLVRVIPG